MQLSPSSVSSSKRRDCQQTIGSRLRTKRKRLDAICEEEYNRNHGDANEGNDDAGSAGADSELRRSTRVRRAPVWLDVSPSPVKKRQKSGKNRDGGGDRSKKNDRLGSLKKENEKADVFEIPGSWKSRLRSRRRKGGVEVKVEEGGSSARRSLLGEMGGSLQGEKAVEGEPDSGKITPVRSKRRGRTKSVNGSGGSREEVEACGVEEVREAEEVEVKQNVVEEGVVVVESEIGHGNEADMEGEALNGVQSEEGCLGNENVESRETIERMEQSDKVQPLEPLNEGGIQENVVEVGNVTDDVEGGAHGLKDDGLVKVDEKPMEKENAVNEEESNQATASTLGKPRIKQGRRCGLCGGGTDGKPPKKLVQDTGESEHEAYSSSASEEPNYDKWDGFGDEPGWLGRLLGPINDRNGIARIWVHQHCAVWSPEVYFAGLGCLKNVRAALCRGRALKCTRCGRPGATIGCRVDRCPKTYHLPCARANGCIFDHRKFLIACTDHRHLFQPHGNQYLMHIKKMKARKMKLEKRKQSNDAWRKDVEAEDKWLEHCGEDEEFLKRESKRLNRDLLRIAPVYIGGSHSESQKLFEGWESVAGLQDVIQCMKEVVILPLLYPEFFDNLGLTPPRGILLHGYPGTGKTLVVRTLIGSCAHGDKRIAYFARKGADCLGKYVGDAERQLRLLFQVAEKCQPSIIFFDEIDGLAPCRSRRQGQTHNSVVSTLLALLDGLKSRGSVVVIGATNRPDAVDPALRRPGRFDREIHFPLPSLEDRAAILALHTKRWPKPVTGSLLKWVARKTAGFAGADLQALCTQAAITALKRNFPLQQILSAAEVKPPGAKRVPLPAFAVEERDWLEALLCSPPPCSRREAGMAAHDIVASPLPTHLIPCLLQPLYTLLVSLHLDERLWLPPLLSKGGRMVESVIRSTLDEKRLPKDHWWSHVDDFLQEEDVAKEIGKRLSQTGILSGEATYAGSDALNDDISDNGAKFKPPVVNGAKYATLSRDSYFDSRKKTGFRVLIAGEPRSGQGHLASCLLHCFVGNVEIHKVDLATISQEGHGDLVQGLTQILMKCASAGSCVVFMPRIDLWALEMHQVTEERDSSSTDKSPSMKEDLLPIEKENESSLWQHQLAEETEPQVPTQSASHAWSSFVEHVESICVSKSLMILATSEVPYQALPHTIKQFFKSDLLNSRRKTLLEESIPRFNVHVGGNFDHDRVIKLSAAELSRDILQPFIHLIHQRSHVCDDIRTNVQDYTSEVNENINHGTASEVGVESLPQPCGDLSINVPPPLPNSRSLKEKSNLMLAISTFGYQILQYPHFAEMCWITSKLKEGPCADISGPWKGWPFNSCIIRPINSSDKVAVAGGSSNVRSKENFGLVRGLIAVGLSAYKGKYTSLREVSFEVRKVLELLVRWINAKVDAGKDRYQYVRILSQVAFLEDMVNNWVYTMQSLEQDVQMKEADPKASTLASVDNHIIGANNPNQISEGNLGVSNSGCPASEGLDASPKALTAQNIDCVDLNKGVGDVAPSPEGRAELSKDTVLQTGKCESTIIEDDLNCSAIASESVNHVDEQNGTNPGPCGSKDIEEASTIDGRPGSLEHSNGFAVRESLIPPVNGFCCADKVDVTNKFSDSQRDCNQNNGSKAETRITSHDDMPKANEHIEERSISPSKTNLVADSAPTCLYKCCSGCLSTLLSVMQEILVEEWESGRTRWTVDDVHDAVASLSVDLLSAVKKSYIFKNNCDRFDENSRHGKHAELSECPELSSCHCKNSGNRLVMPMDCSCHSTAGCLSRGSTSEQIQSGFDPKFSFRDGVMVPVDFNNDASFHCKFETLCLCSLIESILMAKKAFG